MRKPFIRKLIGVTLLALPFIGLFIGTVLEKGFITAIVLWGGSLAVVAVLWTGVCLVAD